MKSAKFYLIVLVAISLIGINGAALADTAQEAPVDPTFILDAPPILVKEFSMDNTKVEGNPKNAAKVIAKKGKRLRPVLAQKLRMRLLRHAYDARAYSADSGVQGALIVDGEYVLIAKSKPRMTVRVWVSRADNPSKRIVESEISAVSTAGPVGMASVAMGNLAHNIIAYLLVVIPPIIENAEQSDVVPQAETEPVLEGLSQSTVQTNVEQNSEAQKRAEIEERMKRTQP